MSNVTKQDERKLDKAVEMTFPASDAPARGEPTGTEPPRRPADRKAPRITREQIEAAQRDEGAEQHAGLLDDSKPVDHPSRETVDVRQGTGPRATVSVLFISLMLAVAAGAVLLAYFILR